MKALIRKDISLLTGQKQFFGALLVMVIMFTVIQNNLSFSISYVTIMFATLTMTTMGYDDFEKGLCYLLTLPVSRRQYVTEKYVFGVLSSICGLIGASFFTIVSAYLKGVDYLWEEWKMTAASCILLIALALAFTTPIQLKFGLEKSRIAIFGAFGIGGLSVIVLVKLSDATGIDIGAALESVLVENLTTTMWGICIIGVIVLIVSYLISVRIFEKKEF